MAGVPVIVHTFHGHVLHGYFRGPTTKFFVLAERLLAGISTALVAVSETVRAELLCLGVSVPAKIHTIPLGLDLSALSGALPRGALRAELGKPSQLLVGIVGRLAPIKDVAAFLQMARLLRSRRADLHFVIAGDGPERAALEAEALRLGVAESVSFLGWRHDLAQLYADLDVVVNCSRNEGTPVALIEALAAGRPVVATRVGGNGDLLQDGQFGQLVAPGDIAALAAAVEKALAGGGTHAAAAATAAARAHIIERYSSNRLIDDMERFYRKLLAASPRASNA